MIADVDKHKSQKFLKRLSLAYRKIQESESAKQDVHHHIQAIRDLSSSKQSRVSDIHAALKELEGKVEIALDKQGKVIKHVYEEQSFNAQLLKGIGSLEKQIENYLKAQERREQKIKEIEQRIREKYKKTERKRKR